jgi:SAM-dependent methyltransferase
MALLAALPERVLALRLALSSVVKSSSYVLDAGCGSLGILAIIAAKLGARRVVAVDLGQLDMARALAEENGVTDRIIFLERDLAELDDSVGNFDVIIGMVYHNDPWRDLGRQQMMAILAKRFGRPGAAIIPDTVRYSAAAYNWTGLDETSHTCQSQWEETVERIEGQTGVTLTAARRRAGPTRSERGSVDWPRRLSPGTLTARFGYPDRGAVKQLTERKIFTEIYYNNPATASVYPPTLALPVTQPGRLDMTIWRQDLMYGDLLIRSTETTYPVNPHQDVQIGDMAVLSINRKSCNAIPVTVHPAR